MRLIEADALHKNAEELIAQKGFTVEHEGGYTDFVLTSNDVRELITNAPTVEREEQDKLAGWVSVDDRLPEKYTEVIVYPPPMDYCITAQYGKFSRSAENDTWYYGEYLAGYGHENNSCKVTHWQYLPAAPKGY